MLMTIMSLLLTMFLMCLMINSPINLGMMILSISLFISSIFALMTSSWFGYITFIIYIGGMLVMFAYFSALQPNQQIMNWAWTFYPTLFIMMYFIWMNNTTYLWSNNFVNIIQIFSFNNWMIPIILAMILFLTLIMVMKTTRADEGPLRPFFYVKTNS
uniref:NADH-ubiquinone oxidoreductase chain 6 n=1 Tax=Laeonereis culveri TaxID=1859080 RepID=A0A1B0ZF13_9ANNE|nr:NADH dehydrogenase subunit 6 [Laeonereis culveri]